MRLTLEDGGPNDADGIADGVVRDPGGIGSIPEVTATGRAKGGSGSINGWLICVLLSLLAVKYAGRWRVLLGAAAMFPIASQAQEQPRWYVGADVGVARSDIHSGDVNARIQALGYDARADVDQERTAWRLYGGYQLFDVLSIQVGYTDLGNADTTITGNPEDVADFLRSANVAQPHAADGFDVALVGRYPLADWVAVTARIGAFYWESEYTSFADGQARTRFKDDGVDWLAGAGLQFPIMRALTIDAGWTRHEIDQEKIDLFSIGAQWRW